jgi:membrane-associated phospholipid phosphatase
MQVQAGNLRQRASILVVLLLLLAGFGVWIMVVGKAASFRMITGYHSPATDFFFRNITHLGDGIFILSLAAILALLKKYFQSIGIVAGYLLSGIFAQSGKKLLALPRPKAWFEPLGETVYEVPGLDVHMKGSFPSGHTASVFALAIFLIILLPYRWYSWLILLVACIVGYSRIYLSQHFPVDVWTGAMIGTFSGIVVYLFLKNSKYVNSKFQNKWQQ